MTAPGFDELIYAPTRLSIVSLLAATEWAAFKYVRETVGLSDSALSKQLATLEDVGYLEVRKKFVGKRPQPMVRLTSKGRQAFDGHVAALQQLVARTGVSVTPPWSHQMPDSRTVTACMVGLPRPTRTASFTR